MFKKLHISLLVTFFLAMVSMGCDSSMDGGNGDVKFNNSIQAMFTAKTDQNGELKKAPDSGSLEKGIAPPPPVLSSNSQEAKFKRFWFKKAWGSANEGVSRDIEGLIYKTGPNAFTVYCPAQSNIAYSKNNKDARKKLVANFETWSPSAEVKVGSTIQTSGVSSNNFKSDVTYTVSLPSSKVPNTYTVKVLPAVDGNILKYSDGSKPYAMNPKHSTGYSLAVSIGSDSDDNIKKFKPNSSAWKISKVYFDTDNNGSYETTCTPGSPTTSFDCDAEIDSSLFEEEDAGKIYEFKIKVKYKTWWSSTKYKEYTKRIAVAEHLEDSSGNTILLPSPVNGYFTAFDFCYSSAGERNLLALAATSVQKFDGSTWTTLGSQSYGGMDPAFVKVLRDNNTILMGAGAGGTAYPDYNYGYFNTINNFVTIDSGNWQSFFAGDLPYHFSADIWDYNYSFSGGAKDWVIINHGENPYGNAHITLTPWNDWDGNDSKEVVDLPGTPSCGVWTSAGGDIYLGACSSTFGQMGGKVYKVSRSDVVSAYNSGDEIQAGTDPEAVVLYDSSLGSSGDTKYTQYSVLGDNMGNIFVTGGSYGSAATTLGGYFETRSGSTQGKTEPIIISASGSGFGYVSLATVSYDKKYMGFVSNTSSGFEVWIIPICGVPASN